MSGRYLNRWKRPDNYIGESWDGWYAFMGQSRDSDALERSNFDCALAALRALPEWNMPDDETPSRIIVHESHWAFGWVEWIAIHETDAVALSAANDIAARLENYPVVDEDHYSELEYNEACEWWARMTVADRLDAIRRSHSAASAFSCRRAEIPADDDGSLLEYLRS